MTRPLTTLLTATLIAGCSSGTREIGIFGPGDGPGADDGNDGGDGNTSDDGDDGGDGDGDGDGDTGDDIRYDVGHGGGGGPGDEDDDEICGKVDFLFVIDGSSSMNDDRDNVVNNFPQFISGIQSTLTSVDSYHVGVISLRGENKHGPDCAEHGSLVSRNVWDDIECGPFADGGNYMTEADDLPSAFSCAADQVGGDMLEVPMLSTQEAVSGRLDGPGLCNEGFLRDDSILVIVIISDEADGPGDPEHEWWCTDGYDGPCTSPGTPSEWFDNIVAYRGGIEQNIVVLTFLNWPGGPCPPTEQGHPGNDAEYYSGFDGTNIAEFTRMFTHGIVGGICEPDWAPYFEQAIGVIDVACDEYTPQG
jgi:hypothetical protein